MKQSISFFAIALVICAVPVAADNSREVFDPAAASRESTTPVDPNAPVWEGPKALLYDNGPLVTHPGIGVGGADESQLQTLLGLTIYGFGHQFTATNIMADDFVVSDAGGWDIDTFTFFAYQSYAGNTSTITGLYVEIYDGEPGNGGTVIWGDQTTNILGSTAWMNAYRVRDVDSGANSDRAIMASTTVSLGPLHLDAGTYWVAWMCDGSASSGPWAPPISIIDITDTGNAVQYTSSTLSWGPALSADTYPQGMPFIIDGMVVPVELQSFTAE